LQYNGNYGSVLSSRSLNFKRHTFTSSSTFSFGGPPVVGTGSGRYTFRKNSIIRFTDNSIFQTGSPGTPVTIQGTARFSKKRVVITETWLISGGSSFSFFWSMRKRG
jgi:hypothetical protein